ncbi:TauD/TfdA family dioxygenase [Dactylosporangium siamense]|uniref:TauD/TfdA-like domain-containing protein n=1 Tax=Dactylosporangium siamense TaxID=685454 RepID=A0A919PL13_9ACTN|nr:TauD/TfdA family dioxygenase [Dactylosporangium siamense]GIG44093.1 hypothetical protein Dsi01nite_021340 [Dactylosporangium siamense]
MESVVMPAERPGWYADELKSSTHWRIPYVADPVALAAAVRGPLDGHPGFALVTDVPIAGRSPEECSDFAPSIVRFLGRPRPQGPAGATTLGWIVRDEGSSRFRPDGSFAPGVYTSKSHDELDIHNDSAMSNLGDEIDYFALLCLGSAAAGGQSVLLSVPTIVENLRQEFSEALTRLCRPYAFERSHVDHGGQQWIMAPVFDERPEGWLVRCNRQRIEMAQALTGKPLTDLDRMALDALDTVMMRPALQFRYTLAEGDLLIINDHLILHARDAFQDDVEAGRRRCLIRVLLDAVEPHRSDT